MAATLGSHGTGLSRHGTIWFHIGHQQHLLSINHALRVIVGQCVVVLEHDGPGRASLFAQTAKDAAHHIDLIALGIALAGRVARGIGIIGSLDQDTLSGAGTGAQFTADTLLQTVVVAFQDMLAPEAGKTARFSSGYWIVVGFSNMILKVVAMPLAIRITLAMRSPAVSLGIISHPFSVPRHQT